MILPNQLTTLRIILSPIFVFFILINSTQSRLIGSVVFLIASLTDLYDGYIARKYGFVTDFGKFLDPLADKILITSAFFSFWILKYIELWMILIIVTRDIIITTLRTYAVLTEKPIITRWHAKAKTFSQNALVYVILIFINFDTFSDTNLKNLEIFYDITSGKLIYILTFIVTIITVLTGLLYLFENRRYVKDILVRIYKRFMESNY